MDKHIRECSLKYWNPGRDLAVDEAMSPFEGRSFDTLIIPGKPIPEGYKIWVLAEKGYFLSWCWHRKGSKTHNKSRGKLGPYHVPQPKELGKNTSSAVVVHLIKQVPSAGYILYLDNLFTNVKLCQYLRKCGVGVVGTATNKSGILKEYGDMKAQDKKKDEIEWGKLFTAPSPDEDIEFIAWKDNALVLFMTTVADQQSMVEKERKRPSETSTSAKTSRKPFGNSPRKVLPIPVFTENYNHKMNAVDQGNQLKAEYTMQRRHRAGGHHSLITWLMDTALVNSYLLSFHSAVSKEAKYTDHRRFHQDIIDRCFDLCKAAQRKRKRARFDSEDSPVLELPLDQHILEFRGKLQDCGVCKGGVIEPKRPRTVLGEISGNKQKTKPRKRSTYGCSTCNIALCKEGQCFNKYHKRMR